MVFVSHNRKRTSKLVKDKSAAEKVASNIRAMSQLNEFDFDKQKKKAIPLFRDFAKGFMETYSATNHKESTRDSYQSVLDVHLIPQFGDMPLDKITKKDVKDFLS